MNITVTPPQAMPLQIKKITLWRREINADPGVFADAITSLTAKGLDLPVLLRYRHPTDKRRAFVEVYPQPSDTDDTWRADLRAAGFVPRHVPVLLIEGGHPLEGGRSLAKIIASLKVNIMFLATQVIDGRCGATIGFESEADAEEAVKSLTRMTTEAPEERRSLEVKESHAHL